MTIDSLSAVEEGLASWLISKLAACGLASSGLGADQVGSFLWWRVLGVGGAG